MQNIKSSSFEGATPQEWNALVDKFGPSDLLPIVVNPHAKLSPRSELEDIGKVPSVINGFGYVVGLAGWSSRDTVIEQVELWRQDPNLGIGIHCRNIKAIDIDIDSDHLLTARILNLLYKMFPDRAWPYRCRPGVSRMLIPFLCSDTFGKGVLKLANGEKIEILANGNQFVAYGWHIKSNTKLMWPEGDLTDASPLSRQELDTFLAEVVRIYLPDATMCWSGGYKAKKHGESFYAEGLELEDELFAALNSKELIINEHRAGVFNIVCPLAHEHSEGKGNDTSTQYFAAGTDGYEHSAIKCLHSHGSANNTLTYMRALGIAPPEVPIDKGIYKIPESVAEEVNKASLESKAEQLLASSKLFQADNLFGVIDEETQVKWLVDDVLPVKSLAMMYGPSGAGKSFVAIDMAYSITTRSAFAERYLCDPHGGTVLYVAAEGAQGVRRRVNVLRQEKGYGLGEKTETLMTIYDGSIDLVNGCAVAAFMESIKANMPKVSLIIFDTLAANMFGDENKSEDGQAIVSNCKYLIDKLNTTVLLVHHTGKDQNLGARGWSGFKAAMDSEISVSLLPEGVRSVKVTKLKDGELTGEEIPFKLVSKPTTGPMITKAKRVLTEGKYGMVEYDSEGNILTVDVNETSTVVRWREVELPIQALNVKDTSHFKEDAAFVLDKMKERYPVGWTEAELLKDDDARGRAPKNWSYRLKDVLERLRDARHIRNEGLVYHYIPDANVVKIRPTELTTAASDKFDSS